MPAWLVASFACAEANATWLAALSAASLASLALLVAVPAAASAFPWAAFAASAAFVDSFAASWATSFAANAWLFAPSIEAVALCILLLVLSK